MWRGHPARDDTTEAPRRPIRLGRERGRVAHDEVDALPRARESPELAEDVMAMLNDIGIDVAPASPEDGDDDGA